MVYNTCVCVCLQERVKLAWQIEKIEYHNSKQKQHNSWFKQAAEAMEIDLDDDMLICKSTLTHQYQVKDSV